MLSNAYFLAKFRFDTAENEPAKNLQNLLIIIFIIFPILPTLTPNPFSLAAHVQSLGGLDLAHPAKADLVPVPLVAAAPARIPCLFAGLLYRRLSNFVSRSYILV